MTADDELRRITSNAIGVPASQITAERLSRTSEDLVRVDVDEEGSVTYVGVRGDESEEVRRVIEAYVAKRWLAGDHDIEVYVLSIVEMIELGIDPT